MTTDTSTKDTQDLDTQANDTHNDLQLESHPLHELQMAIAALPAVDAERVEEVLRKLRAGKIDILGSPEQRLASAERIAKQIIDATSETE